MSDLSLIGPTLPDTGRDFVVVHHRPDGFNGTTEKGSTRVVPLSEIGTGGGTVEEPYDVLSGGAPATDYSLAYTITGGNP